MRHPFLCLWLLAICATLALRIPTLAQEAESGDNPPAQSKAVSAEDTEAETLQSDAAKKQARVLETEGGAASSGPDIYLLPDESGSLRKVLGFRYEDFLKAWQQRNNAGKTAPPKYLLDSIRVSGTANDSHATLHLELDILPRVKGWIDVPLELPALMVQEWEIDGQSKDECLVFDLERDSHVLWLKSEPNKRRTLKLQGLSKLKLAPANPSLELKLPHAGTSKFVLQVPIADAQFEVSPGVDMITAANEDGGTEVQLSGQAQPLRVQWKSSEQQVQTGDTVVEAIGQMAVQLDRRRAHYDVELAINSYGKPLERLRVQLPVGAKLTGEHLSDDYQVVEQTLDDERGDIVEIELPQPRSEPWTLRLSAEQSLSRSENDGGPENETDTTYRITGFKVLNAFRQSGTLALHVDEQLRVYFDLRGDIEQTPNQETAQSLQSSMPMARFAYTRFSWVLDAHTLEPQPRISVVPRYEMQIEQGEADLNVEFEYQFSGAQTFAIRIDMRGWERTDSPIESDGAVDQDRIFEKPGGLLVLPLVNPDVKQLRLSMAVRRSVSLGHNTLPLPVAQEAFVLSGPLSVEADPSMQVIPTIVAAEGVSVVTNSEDAQNTDSADPRDLAKDVLHLRTFLPRASLSAELKLRERQVAVDVETRVDADQEAIRVLQQLKYEVKYRPTSLLLLRVPEKLWDNDSLKVQLDGEDLQFNLGIFTEELPSDENGIGPETPAMAVRQLRISLPRPRQNKFQLDLSYEVPCPDLAAEAISPLALPLLFPDDQVLTNVVAVHTAKPLRATLNQTADEGPWSGSTGSEPSEAEAASLQMKGSGKPATIPLLLQLESEENVELPTLEQAWLQTWIVGEQQQIRAIFRFRSSQQTILAQLPSNLQKSSIEVLLNGSPVEFDLFPQRRVAVQLPEVGVLEKYTLELRYLREASLAGWGVLHVKLPRLECHATPAPVFWHLVLPTDWHVANVPDQLAAEFQLGWKKYRWGRQPTHYQAELEHLTGATSTPPPPASSNQYLYRGFVVPHEINVLVVSHLWLVMTSTLAAFGIGMLLIYTSIAKNVPFWIFLALALSALVFSYPEFALLTVQAIFWGGAMTLAATFLRKTFVGISRPEYVLAPTAKSDITAVTESWIHGRTEQNFGEESNTTSIQTSGPVP